MISSKLSLSASSSLVVVSDLCAWIRLPIGHENLCSQNGPLWDILRSKPFSALYRCKKGSFEKVFHDAFLYDLPGLIANRIKMHIAVDGSPEVFSLRQISHNLQRIIKGRPIHPAGCGLPKHIGDKKFHSFRVTLHFTRRNDFKHRNHHKPLCTEQKNN